MTIIIENLSQVPNAASAILAEHKTSRIFALSGEMGAGKTTLIQELCKIIGCNDSVVSPTFTLVNEYFRNTHEPVYHFDFYRIDSITEAFDFGIEEYLTGEYYCFIEWPDIIEPLLPPETISVIITVNPDGSRKIEM